MSKQKLTFDQEREDKRWIDAVEKAAKQIKAEGKNVPEAVVDFAKSIGASPEVFKEAIETYKGQKQRITNYMRNKKILQNPEQVKDWDLAHLYKERDRVEKQIQELEEMKADKKKIKNHLWEAGEIRKDLDAKAEYDLKGWDRVELDEQAIKDISAVIKEQMDSHDYDIRHVAVRRLAVTFKDEIYYFTVVSANLLHVRIWEDYPDVQTFSAEYDIKIYPKRLELTNTQKCDSDMIDFLRQCNDGSGVRNYETTGLMFLMLNEFMLHYKDVAFNVREIECKGPGKKKEYKNSTVVTSVVRLVKQYKLKKNWQAKVERRKAEIRCQAWGVRGHFRHYKDGKVIFVEAYVKGKDREQYRGKVYELLPKEAKNE